MSLYEPWAAAVCTLVILAVIGTPAFAVADAPPNDGKDRLLSLDGVRGFAAFGVFLHHALIARGYLADGVWTLPPSRFFSMAGQVGVSVFFITTGYLFASMLIRERGRPRWVALYIGRVLRIGPVYSLSIAALILIACVKYGLPPRSGWDHAARDVLRWLSLGIVPCASLDDRVDLGVYGAGVAWTLRYEWAFYAALPALAFGLSKPRTALATAGLLGICGVAWWSARSSYILQPQDQVLALLFVSGIGCAALEANGVLLRWPQPVLSAIALVLVIGDFVLFPQAYGLLAIVPLSAAFYCVVSGATVFGVLVARPARRLGHVSFGIYILQGPVLTLAFWPSAVTRFALSGSGAYWLVVLSAGLALVSIATLAHRWVERPGIRAGHQLTAWLRLDRRVSTTGGVLRH